MSKQGSVSVLLVVAVIALGLMAFIGFNDGATGAVQVGGGISPSVSMPSHPDSYYYQQGGATASDYSNVKMMTQDLLQLELAMHCPGATAADVVKLCVKYSVPTS